MISTQLRGRLGNQMFQYCLCRIIAIKNNYNFHIPTALSDHGQNLSHYFELDMGEPNGVINNTFTEDHTIQRFNPDLFNLPDFTKISGFFQTEKYFDGYEDNIKEWFKVKTSSEIDTLLNRYPVDRYCYIHFRGGDYMDITEWLLPVEYYREAMGKIREEKKDIKFLIITDSVNDAKPYFDECEVISNDMMTDFSLLYHSKYCIITNSTFAWWASWLSNKTITIAPDRWLNYNKQVSNFYPLDIKTEKFTYI